MLAILSFISKRILWALPTLLAVSIIGFVLLRFEFTVGPLSLPGWVVGQAKPLQLLEKVQLKQPIDPLALLRNNPAISAEALKKEEHRLGLTQPMYIQYWRWLKSFSQGDLGKTFSGVEVSTLLVQRAGNTLLLNITSIVFTWLFAIPLGVYAAVFSQRLRWQWVDRVMTGFSAIGLAVPGFVLALFLALFAVATGWFPIGGLTSYNFDELNVFQKLLDIVHHLILPTVVLSISGVASLQRQMRGNLLEILGAEYVRTARAKGLSETVVLYKHAVRNAINPLITLMGYELAALLSGAVLVEIILGYPGLGFLMYQAVLQGDTNLVMASLLMSAGMLVFGNLVADILLSVADPRVALE